MGELLHKLGIDWKLLLAQIVNFLILFFVLKKFLYKPILGFLDKRRALIEKSLKDAERLEGEMARVKEMRGEIIKKANQRAEEIFKEARDLADAKKAEILRAASSEAERLIAETKKTLGKEKERLIDEAREDLAELVLLAVEKVVRERLDNEKDKALIRETISRMNL